MLKEKDWEKVSSNINKNIKFLVDKKREKFRAKYFRPYTLDSIAEEIGITKQSLHDTLNNKNGCSLQKLILISEYFDVSIDGLIYDDLSKIKYIEDLERLQPQEDLETK